MARTNDKAPKLKTLFRIGIWKPGDSRWNIRMEELSEITTLPLFVYDSDILDELVNSENIPDYIIRVFDNNHKGYVNVTDVPIYMNHPTFTGRRFTLELDPMYDRTMVLYDLHNQLKNIADKYAENHDIVLDFDERYSWAGGHLRGLIPPMERSKQLGR